MKKGAEYQQNPSSISMIDCPFSVHGEFRIMDETIIGTLILMVLLSCKCECFGNKDIWSQFSLLSTPSVRNENVVAILSEINGLTNYKPSTVVCRKLKKYLDQSMALAIK